MAGVVEVAGQATPTFWRGWACLKNGPGPALLQASPTLPMPRLTHLPLITAENGQKLSKQNLAPALPEDASAIRTLLHHTLTLLGQAPPSELATASPAEQLAHAIPRWSLAAVGTAPSLSAATAPMPRVAESR